MSTFRRFTGKILSAASGALMFASNIAPAAAADIPTTDRCAASADYHDGTSPDSPMHPSADARIQKLGRSANDVVASLTALAETGDDPGFAGFPSRLSLSADEKAKTPSFVRDQFMDACLKNPDDRRVLHAPSGYVTKPATKADVKTLERALQRIPGI